MKELKLPAEPTNFLLYSSSDGQIRVDVYLQNETLWLTQKEMAELFGV